MKALLLISLALLATHAHADDDTTVAAIFAGGCFWCMEPPYDNLDGVISTTSGYIGGDRANPTYEAVSSGRTGHTEAVRIVYDPARVDYLTLLETFWINIDPLTKDRQFCDRGSQYRSGIFYLNDEQERLARQTRSQVAERFDKPIATEVTAAGTFYPAEDYHQDYYQKNPLRYKYYRFSCGRDNRLEELWERILR
ncbi:MAG: peptide-methionine (S)-S-oxide reductase MsrA [Gammaproteobacteria bacterium]|nr:peptide-methionine (S)-S-oxide reductase MsrA [Gammaproteobacteria bacterium]